MIGRIINTARPKWRLLSKSKQAPAVVSAATTAAAAANTAVVEKECVD
jgi:hypothetical protein